MKLFAVSDDRDTLTGLRLAGIEGRLVQNKKEIEAEIEKVRADSQIAVLLITEGCAEKVPEKVTELKLGTGIPLLVVIPDSHGKSNEADSITKLISETIGIKL